LKECDLGSGLRNVQHLCDLNVFETFNFEQEKDVSQTLVQRGNDLLQSQPQWVIRREPLRTRNVFLAASGFW
jgi:predicted HTH transcriptional regulator